MQGETINKRKKLRLQVKNGPKKKKNESLKYQSKGPFGIEAEASLEKESVFADLGIDSKGGSEREYPELSCEQVCDRPALVTVAEPLDNVPQDVHNLRRMIQEWRQSHPAKPYTQLPEPGDPNDKVVLTKDIVTASISVGSLHPSKADSVSPTYKSLPPPCYRCLCQRGYDKPEVLKDALYKVRNSSKQDNKQIHISLQNTGKGNSSQSCKRRGDNLICKPGTNQKDHTDDNPECEFDEVSPGTSGEEPTDVDSTFSSCPLCQKQFTPDQGQLERDSHLAACVAASGDDVVW